jgi:hypothetical protein
VFSAPSGEDANGVVEFAFEYDVQIESTITTKYTGLEPTDKNNVDECRDAANWVDYSQNVCKFTDSNIEYIFYAMTVEHWADTINLEGDSGSPLDKKNLNVQIRAKNSRGYSAWTDLGGVLECKSRTPPTQSPTGSPP